MWSCANRYSVSLGVDETVLKLNVVMVSTNSEYTKTIELYTLNCELYDAVTRIMTSQRYLCPNPWNV